MGNTGITEAKTTNSENYLFEQRISQKIMVLEITGEETGYTIQALKGIDYVLSDPAVIVKTYKVNVVIRNLNRDGVKISDKIIDSFNVTRDSWYYLGNKIIEVLLINHFYLIESLYQITMNGITIQHCGYLIFLQLGHNIFLEV